MKDDSYAMESFGKRLERMRIQAGFSQKELSQRAGISASTHRDWEYGKQIMGEPYLNLAAALNVTLTELMTGQKSLNYKILQDLGEIERVVESIRKTAVTL